MSESSKQFLTIAIPTYNRAEYLRRQLECVCNQIVCLGRGDVSVKVGDNGSTDATLGVIEEFQKSYNFVGHLRASENRGFDGNIVSLYNATHSKWMWLLSDDDPVRENALSIILTTLSKNKDEAFLTFSENNPRNIDSNQRQYSTDAINRELSRSFFSCIFISGLVINLSEKQRMRWEAGNSTNFPQVTIAANLLCKRKTFVVVCEQIVEREVSKKTRDLFKLNCFDIRTAVENSANCRLKPALLRRLDFQLALFTYDMFLLRVGYWRSETTLNWKIWRQLFRRKSVNTVGKLGLLSIAFVSIMPAPILRFSAQVLTLRRAAQLKGEENCVKTQDF